VRRRVVGVAAAALISTLSLVISGLASAPASADNPKADARHKALVLADQVATLETKVEIAGEAYAAQQDELNSIVSQQIDAEQQLDKVRASTASDGLAFRQQVRELYLGAGDVSLLPSLLRGSSPQDVLDQLDTMDRVLAHQQVAAGGVQRQISTAQATSTRLEQLANQRTALANQADQAQAAVDDLLNQRQAALSSASDQVLALEQADILKREEAAAARAAATLISQNLPVSPDLPNPLPPASPLAATAISAAAAEVGKPYQYAGNGPDVFDCSGLTRWAYAAAGIALPRTSREQWSVGPHVALADLQPGDLLFWATDITNPATIHHVAIYVGEGWMLQAPHTGELVQFSRIYLDGYIGATRPPGV
jgi:cell wall-associated NlpC family hydrolase